MPSQLLRIVRMAFVLGVFTLTVSAVNFEWTPTSFQIIPDPPGALLPVPQSINDGGVVTFSSADTSGNPAVPITWDGSSFHQYPVPSGFTTAEGVAMNNLGVLAGTAYNYSGNVFTESPTLWYPDGRVVTLGGPGTVFYRSVVGINNHNQVLSNGSQPFIWNAGTFTVLNGISGYPQTSASAINDAGLVIGNVLNWVSGLEEPVFWAPGSQSPTVLPCNINGTAHAVNNSGEIAGSCGGQGVIWDTAGNMRVIGPGGLYGINDRGEAVGDGGSNAFFWSPVSGLTYLTHLNGLEFAYSFVEGINNEGVVIATGEPSTVIPEPATVGLAAVAFLLLLRARKRSAPGK